MPGPAQILAEASLKDKIRVEVNEGLEKRQREFYLRQQLAAIKKELGDTDGDALSDYRQKVTDTPFPDDVRKEVERELDRLERTSEQNPEQGWIRNYLDWMLELPWGKKSEDRFDVAEARRILDEDHTGLDDVKERIVEFLAIKKRREGRHLQPSAAVARARSSRWSARQASARHRWVSRLRVPWGAVSPACRWAESTTKQRSAATAARMSAHCRVALPAR